MTLVTSGRLAISSRAAGPASTMKMRAQTPLSFRGPARVSPSGPSESNTRQISPRGVTMKIVSRLDTI